MSQGNKFKVVLTPDLYPHKETRRSGVKVIEHHENLEWLLDHFHASIRHNQMTRKREIILPDTEFFKDDVENDSLTRIEEIAALNFFPWRNVDKFLDVIAGKSAYHPIVRSILTAPWDGVKRLSEFITTIKSTTPEMDKLIIRTWMTAAIAAAFSDKGFTNHGVLVLQGEQGIGKTEWVRKLDPISCGAVAVGVLLDPKSKDSIIGANRFWIVELGEVDATFNKADIAHLKSYITSSVDNIRVPWGRRENAMVRRTAYIATVNEHNFLVDTTGNRRWWVVSATEIDYQHDFNMQQVWAEVYAEWQAGALTYLPKDLQAQVNEKNVSHEKVDPLLELLTTSYDWTTTSRRQLTATDILIELDFKKPTIGECMRIAKMLIKINGKDGRKSNGVKIHDIPNKLSYGIGR